MGTPANPTALLQGIVESSEDAIIGEDLDGSITLWNRGAERLFGYTRAQAVGQSARLVVPPERGDDEAALRRRVLGGERIEHYETSRLCQDGRRVAVSLAMSPIKEGDRVSGLSHILRDITERQRLQRADLHLAALVQSSDDAIASKDLNGIVLSWNPAAERMFGYPAEEIIGRSIRLIIPEDRWDEEDDVLARIRKGQRIDHFETVRRRKDGSPIHISLTVSPIHDLEGKVIGASKTARDLSALRAYATTLESTVLERTAALESANTQLESFAYSVSHDLRAPLRGVHGLAQALLEDYGPQLDDRARDYAARIVLEATHLDYLIRDMLAYSRLGRIEVLLEAVEVRAVIDVALHNLQDDILSAHATVEIAPTHATVRANRTVLAQVITNLLSNAIKFGGAHPVVRVRVEHHDDRTRVWVEDEGIGIAPRHHERIFRAFERLHGVERYPGTGIGLAIVSKAIERLGGTVGVESDEGHGSRFWFELPDAEAA